MTASPHKIKRVALLTSGGLAPCLSTAVAALIERFTDVAPSIEILCYHSGYQGLLRGDSFLVGRVEREVAVRLLFQRGGSPLGNSRVKLTNRRDCEKRGLVKPGEDPLVVAARQLTADGVDVLMPIGGDDSLTTAASLVEHLAKKGSRLLVCGIPKTIDNDVFPVRQSLGWATAAIEGANYFRSVVDDATSSSRVLIVHEVMGRSSGSLCARTALEYTKLLDRETLEKYLPLRQGRAARECSLVIIPELENFVLEHHTARLKEHLERTGSCNIFVSEGAKAAEIADEMRKKGEAVPVDAFGHVRLDAVNVGRYFAKKIGEAIGARKVTIVKSGYYARSAPSCAEDLALIKSCAHLAVQTALSGKSGVMGHDDRSDYEEKSSSTSTENRGGTLRSIEFSRIKGHKIFNVKEKWFVELLTRLGQNDGKKNILRAKL